MSSISSPSPVLPLKQDQLRINLNENYEDNRNISLFDLNKFAKKAITTIRPLPQTGPNCGLVALAMVATLTPSTITVSDIFNIAISRRFTNNGEMFSALDMKALAEVVLSSSFRVELLSDGLAVNRKLVVDSLYSGDLMLIPYDADKDHSPCCKKGHKAHWGLVCGVMTGDNGEVFVAARHGKSRYLAVWPLDSLQWSNENLVELDPDRAADSLEYVIPQGGVGVGLASKFILLRKQNV